MKTGRQGKGREKDKKEEELEERGGGRWKGKTEMHQPPTPRLWSVHQLQGNWPGVKHILA